MEDNDNNNPSNQFNNDDDHNRIVKKLLRTNNSSKRKQLFWYDIRNFPDSLLIEILVRLPVKSMFVLKSVCKHWQTLISDPSFCRFYHSILNSSARLSSRPFRILDKYTWVPNLKEFLIRLRAGIHSSSEFSVLFLSNHRRRQPIYDQLRVLDMSNGLILCCMWNSTPWVYYICDPLTGQWISLPRREHRTHDTIVQGLIPRVSENHMLIGYTVVRADFLKSRSNYLSLEMFSSETRKWIPCQVPCVIPTGLREEGDCPIHCYGALHWLVCYDRTYGIIAFNPNKEKKSVRLIPLPNDRDLESEYDNGGWLQLCGECQGTLRYFEVAEEDSTESYLFKMWAMKDYEKGEWCCEFKVRRSDLHSTDLKLNKWLKYDWFRPLCFHPLNPNVVYLNCMEPECIVSYDVLNRRLDVAYKPIDINDHISQKSAIPFVLPRWPVLLSVASQPCLTEGHLEVKRKRRKQRRKP